MKQKRFNVEQIVAVLKQAEVGLKGVRRDLFAPASPQRAHARGKRAETLTPDAWDGETVKISELRAYLKSSGQVAIARNSKYPSDSPANERDAVQRTHAATPE
jgi:hypothetical protein